MTEQTNLGGTFTFLNTSMTVNRMGYGVLPVAVVLLLGAWQDGRRAHRRLAAQARPALLPERKIPVDK